MEELKEIKNKCSQTTKESSALSLENSFLSLLNADSCDSVLSSLTRQPPEIEAEEKEITE